MSTTILRSVDAWWVDTGDGAARIETDATTTAELLAEPEKIEAARSSKQTVDPANLNLVSPVTAPCRVVAQMTNYASHVKDAGMKPDTIPLTFFRKTSGAISGPNDDIIQPDHVRFLDYEAEVGVLIGRELRVGTQVTLDTWATFVAGLVVTNDVSARDVQLPKTQFFESKSYPSFTPVGPALVLLDENELKRFGDLRLRLWVNGEIRQNALVDPDMLYSPFEALRALSRFQRLHPGDLLLTGTPVGTALSAPAKPVQIISSLLPAATKWKMFFKSQAQNPMYLKDGDVVEVTIGTDDGAINLGRQRTVIRGTR
jgi:2-keto-4-pentenoate hydratase/2-oxohepta-3-ene-1,7-dioic acid hydratase in catechol pathway